MIGKNEILIIGILLLAAAGLYMSQQKAVAIDADEYSHEFVIPPKSVNLDINRGDFTLTLKKMRDVNSESFMISSAYQYAKKMSYDRPADLFVQGFHVWPVKDQRTADMLSGGGQSRTFKNMAEAQKFAQEVKNLGSSGFNFTILPADATIFEQAKGIQKDDVIEASGILYRQVKEVNNGVTQRQTFCNVNTNVFYVTRLDIIK